MQNAPAKSHRNALSLRAARNAHTNAKSAYGIANPSDNVRLVQISFRYGFHIASAAVKSEARQEKFSSSESSNSVAHDRPVNAKRAARQTNGFA